MTLSDNKQVMLGERRGIQVLVIDCENEDGTNDQTILTIDEAWELYLFLDNVCKIKSVKEA